MSVLIGGFFGYGNLGDEAMLAGLLEGLAQAGPAHVTVLRGPVAWTGRRTDEVRQVPGILTGLRWLASGRGREVGRYVRAFRGPGAYLLAIGSGLEHARGLPALLHLFGRLWLARKGRRRIALSAVGLGAAAAAGNGTLLRRVIMACDLVVVRDQISREAALAHGADPTRLLLGADLALSLPSPPPDAADGLLAEAGIALDRPFAAVCLVDPKGWPGGAAGHPDRLAALAAGIGRIQGEGVQIVAMPCMAGAVGFPHQDARAGVALQSALGGPAACAVIQRPPTVPEAQALLGRAAWVLSERLHGLVLAAGAGTPAAALPAPPKAAAFSAEAGFPVLSASDVAKEVPAAWNRRAETAAALAGRRPTLVSRSRIGLDALVAFARACEEQV